MDQNNCSTGKDSKSTAPSQDQERQELTTLSEVFDVDDFAPWDEGFEPEEEEEEEEPSEQQSNAKFFRVEGQETTAC